MKPDSGRLIHIGINFRITPPPILSHQALLLFQQAIMSQGLEYQKLEHLDNQLVLLRETPSPLQISILVPDAQVGQIVVVAAHQHDLKSSASLFTQEAEAALGAFETVWPGQNRLIIQCDATIIKLYETTSDHAFQELWENRLAQPSQALASFDRPIRGGGLRFVMDPLLGENDPAQIEVKIESLLRDTSKIYLEAQFVWPKPSVQGEPFKIRERLERMNSYIETEIRQFILGASS